MALRGGGETPVWMAAREYGGPTHADELCLCSCMDSVLLCILPATCVFQYYPRLPRVNVAFADQHPRALIYVSFCFLPLNLRPQNP